MNPSSIGIIPDGNRRYAKAHGLGVIESYKLGTSKAWEFIDWLSVCRDIKFGTFYTLSHENLARNKLELNALLRIFDSQLDDVLKKPIFEEKGIRLKFIGSISSLPGSLRKKIVQAEKYTEGFNEKLVQLAIGYSGRTEILEAAKAIALDCRVGKFDIDSLNEDSFRKYLYSDAPDPDLIIRTSGTKRLSGFLTYQTAYSEFYFSDKYWPEFTKKDFDLAIEDYSSRKRNFGK